MATLTHLIHPPHVHMDPSPLDAVADEVMPATSNTQLQIILSGDADNMLDVPRVPGGDDDVQFAKLAEAVVHDPPLLVLVRALGEHVAVADGLDQGLRRVFHVQSVRFFAFLVKAVV